MCSSRYENRKKTLRLISIVNSALLNQFFRFTKKKKQALWPASSLSTTCIHSSNLYRQLPQFLAVQIDHSNAVIPLGQIAHVAFE